VTHKLLISQTWRNKISSETYMHVVIQRCYYETECEQLLNRIAID
jgi:hypothetical protein